MNPVEAFDVDVTRPVEFIFDDTMHKAKVRIIEWSEDTGQAVYLCDRDGVPIDEVTPSVFAPEFSYAAYVCWDEMPNYKSAYLLGDGTENSVVGALLTAVKGDLASYFDGRRAVQIRHLVGEWQHQGVYPYSDSPVDEAGQIERTTFDVVATTIRRHLPREKGKRRLTLALLKSSLQHEPDGTSRLLHEVLNLPDEDKERLQRLLDRTSLARLIQASNNITGRIDFIAALDHLVHDPETKYIVKERAHLHKILERELWVFGEQYNMMLSERSLTAVLDRHERILNRAPKRLDSVRRIDGTTGRVDLLLSAASTEHERNRHLVVELKAPSTKATDRELSQLKSYAKAVVRDPRFSNTETDWDFWLVTSSMDEDVLQETRQRNRPIGCAWDPDLPAAPHSRVRVWVRTWGEIIEENRRRLSYYRSTLSHDPSIPDALEYLKRTHGDLLPAAISTPAGSSLTEVTEK